MKQFGFDTINHGCCSVHRLSYFVFSLQYGFYRRQGGYYSVSQWTSCMTATMRHMHDSKLPFFGLVRFCHYTIGNYFSVIPLVIVSQLLKLSISENVCRWIMLQPWNDYFRLPLPHSHLHVQITVLGYMIFEPVCVTYTSPPVYTTAATTARSSSTVAPTRVSTATKKPSTTLPPKKICQCRRALNEIRCRRWLKKHKCQHKERTRRHRRTRRQRLRG